MYYYNPHHIVYIMFIYSSIFLCIWAFGTLKYLLSVSRLPLFVFGDNGNGRLGKDIKQNLLMDWDIFRTHFGYWRWSVQEIVIFLFFVLSFCVALFEIFEL